MGFEKGFEALIFTLLAKAMGDNLKRLCWFLTFVCVYSHQIKQQLRKTSVVLFSVDQAWIKIAKWQQKIAAKSTGEMCEAARN